MKSLYQIVTYEEFIRMGYQLYAKEKDIKTLAHDAMLAYQLWVRDMTEELLKDFEDKVETWRKGTAGKRFTKEIAIG